MEVLDNFERGFYCFCRYVLRVVLQGHRSSANNNDGDKDVNKDDEFVLSRKESIE